MPLLQQDVVIDQLPAARPGLEVVERKGTGHPDTLADHLAEALSRAYANETRRRFGAVLHHNFDKVGLLGGRSHVEFGDGHLTAPIRVLINGRVSTSFAGEPIDSTDLIRQTVIDFFTERFRGRIGASDLQLHFNLSNGSSNGVTDETSSERGSRKFWFEPRGLQDLPELTDLHSNDTSVGCGYAPLSATEQAVLAIEGLLNGPEYKARNPWCGSDIKVMAANLGSTADVTVCVPQIADEVPGLPAYRDNLARVRSDLEAVLRTFFGDGFRLHLNTRDEPDTGRLYLTATGSSIESGDEGLVGRGNRVNGLITNTRPMSLEGASGKNPVYHVGKLYNVAAFRIAQAIHRLTRSPAEVYLVSQTGRPLLAPWKTYVRLGENAPVEGVAEIVREQLAAIPVITEELLRGEISLA